MLLSRVSVALLAGAAIAGCGGAGSPGGAPGALPAIHHRTSGSSPIQHVIIVIQENRSFDDLFATFPKADGTTTGQGEPMPQAEAATCAKDNQHGRHAVEHDRSADESLARRRRISGVREQKQQDGGLR